MHIEKYQKLAVLPEVAQGNEPVNSDRSKMIFELPLEKKGPVIAELSELFLS